MPARTFTGDDYRTEPEPEAGEDRQASDPTSPPIQVWRVATNDPDSPARDGGSRDWYVCAATKHSAAAYVLSHAWTTRSIALVVHDTEAMGVVE